jgi:hypothetical protein
MNLEKRWARVLTLFRNIFPQHRLKAVFARGMNPECDHLRAFCGRDVEHLLTAPANTMLMGHGLEIPGSNAGTIR